MKAQLESAIESGIVTLFWYTGANSIWAETFVNGVSFSARQVK